LLTAKFRAINSLFVKKIEKKIIETKIFTTCDQNISYVFHQHMYEYNFNA